MGGQKLSDLSLERIVPDLPPFSNVGIDYFGPIEIIRVKIMTLIIRHAFQRGRAFEKRYGVIFTCKVSRAFHYEVAYSYGFLYKCSAQVRL